MTGWRKWLFIGIGFGIGFGIIVTAIFGVATWYSNKPRPWNESAIRATFSTYLINLDVDNNITGKELEYIFENRTGTDFTLSPDQTFMLVDGPALRKSVTGNYGVKQPCLVPSGNKVKCDIAVREDFDTTSGIGGFVVFDTSLHYKILLPKATSPTPDDWGKAVTHFQSLKLNGSLGKK